MMAINDQLKLFLLGAPRIERGGQVIEIDRQKAVALLAFLALQQRPHSREELAALLWPDYDRPRSLAYLRRALWTLGQSIGADWIASERDRLRLRQDGVWVDALVFRQLIEQGANQSELVYRETLEQAVALYRGDLLAGLSVRDSAGFEEWQLLEADQLRRELASALDRLGNAHATAGAYEAALRAAHRRLQLDPLHEPTRRQLMEWYARSGQRSIALRQYQELCRLLQQELGIEPQAETQHLFQRLRAGELDRVETSVPAATIAIKPAVALASEPGDSPTTPGVQLAAAIGANTHTWSLPAQSTPFLGRQQELAEVAQRLVDPQCRLLTLVGPGGIGKTRLALEAATQVRERFLNGAAFVSLVALNDSILLVTTIGDGLGFTFRKEDQQRQLFDFLRAKQVLLVLDNFEQLIAGANLLGELLEAAPELKLLVTSRERLNLRGEWVIPVEGMPVPRDERATDIDSYAVVQLFTSAARRVDPHFVPGPAEYAAIVRICQLVQGIPLGIELAAAWMRLLSPQEIADEIARSLDFLGDSLRDLPERHRSLRAVFEHSWRLLSSDEQRVFRGLSIFRAAFSREAALSVLEDTQSLERGAPVAAARARNTQHLAALVDKSLLRRGPDQRFQLHELLRQYAAEQLAAWPEEYAQLRANYCSYYTELLARNEPRLKGNAQRLALEQLRQEIDNLRTAWEWMSERGDLPALDRSAQSLFQFYELESLFPEGERSFRNAVEQLQRIPVQNPEQHATVLAHLIGLHGWFLFRTNQVPEGHARYKEALDLIKHTSDMSNHALIWLLLLSSYYQPELHNDELERLIQQTIATYRTTGDQWGVALGLMTLADFEFGRYGAEAASQRYKESLAISRALGDRRGMSTALGALAEASQTLGQLDEARRYLEQGLNYSRELGYQYAVSLTLDRLGYVLRMLGDYDRAEAAHRESLLLSRELGDSWGISGSLDNLALLARDRGELDAARWFAEEALALRRIENNDYTLAISLESLGSVAALQGRTNEARQLLQQANELHGPELHETGARVQIWLGRVLTHEGAFEQAIRTLHDALLVSRRLKAFTTLLDGLLALAQLLLVLGKTGEAAAALAVLLGYPLTRPPVRQQATQLAAQLAGGIDAALLEHVRQHPEAALNETITRLTGQAA